MMTYITAFIFYTMAMIGVMLLGFVVYKKTMMPQKNETKGMIKILDSLPIGNKKSLLVVRIKNEKFLIASGLEHTTFLSKLEEDNSKQEKNQKNALNSIPQVQFENQEPSVADIQKQKMEKIKSQFMELYSQNPIEEQKKPVMDKREMVKALLKDLNEATNVQTGSRF